MPSGGWARGQGDVLAGPGRERRHRLCTVHTATAAATGLQSASIQLGMARAGMSLHPPPNDKSKVKELMNNRKNHSGHHLFQGGAISAEQNALVKA